MHNLNSKKEAPNSKKVIKHRQAYERRNCVMFAEKAERVSKKVAR
jgi:hypothetical protein